MKINLGIAAAIFLLLGLLVGCDRAEVDQQLRREIFMECLGKAPAGPVSTKYNDWAEVVGSNPGKAKEPAR